MTDVNERPPSRRREQTRTRLLDAAMEVFTEVGMDAASVEEICDRAGFTRGAFYSNFASKGELFVALISRLADEKLTDVASRVRGLADGAPEDPIALVSHIVGAALGTHIQPELFNEVCAQAMRDESLAEAYLAWSGSLENRVGRLIEELAAEHSLTLRIPTGRAANLMISVVNDAATLAKIERRNEQSAHEAVAAAIEEVALLILK